MLLSSVWIGYRTQSVIFILRFLQVYPVVGGRSKWERVYEWKQYLRVITYSNGAPLMILLLLELDIEQDIGPIRWAGPDECSFQAISQDDLEGFCFNVFTALPIPSPVTSGDSNVCSERSAPLIPI